MRPVLAQAQPARSSNMGNALGIAQRCTAMRLSAGSGRRACLHQHGERGIAQLAPRQVAVPAAPGDRLQLGADCRGAAARQPQARPQLRREAVCQPARVTLAASVKRSGDLSPARHVTQSLHTSATSVPRRGDCCEQSSPLQYLINPVLIAIPQYLSAKISGRYLKLMAPLRMAR